MADVAAPVNRGAQLYAAERRRDRARKLLRALIGVAVVLVVWEAVAKLYHLEVILPPPTATAGHLVDVLLLKGTWPYGPNIYAQVGLSLERAVIGFGIGVLAGTPIGLLVGRARWARETAGPILKAFYPIPGIAWVPLMILWFGLNGTAIIAMVSLAVFFPVYFNAESGARAVPEVQIFAGLAFGASGLRLFRRVVLPSAVPYLVSGLRIGLGTGWRMVIAGEIVVGQSGMGFIINQSRFLFKTEDLIAAMAIIAAVGYATERILVGVLERRTLGLWGYQDA